MANVIPATLVLLAIYLLAIVIEGKEKELIKQLKSDMSDLGKFIVGILALIFLLNIPALGDIIALFVDVMAIAVMVKDYQTFVEIIQMFNKFISEV